MPETLDPSIPSAEDWAEVQFLIAEVQQAERETARYAACILMWDVAARAFRLVERRELFEQAPSPENLKVHGQLLGSLIKLGEILEIRIQNIEDEGLATFNIRRENLTAYIRELKDTFAMWHGPELEPGRAAEIEKAIFGGSS
jgi:hypothetical protein